MIYGFFSVTKKCSSMENKNEIDTFSLCVLERYSLFDFLRILYRTIGNTVWFNPWGKTKQNTMSANGILHILKSNS